MLPESKSVTLSEPYNHNHPGEAFLLDTIIPCIQHRYLQAFVSSFIQATFVHQKMHFLVLEPLSDCETAILDCRLCPFSRGTVFL